MSESGVFDAIPDKAARKHKHHVLFTTMAKGCIIRMIVEIIEGCHVLWWPFLRLKEQAMYGKGASSVVGSATVTGAGALILPNTGGNTLATVLAYAAITVGAAALISQVVVRVMRRKYES